MARLRVNVSEAQKDTSWQMTSRIPAAKEHKKNGMNRKFFVLWLNIDNE